MTDFAKILRVDGEQVVVMRGSNNEEGEYVSLTFHLTGGTVNINVSDFDGDPEEMGDVAFNTAEEWVPDQVRAIRDQFEGCMEEDEDDDGYEGY